ncbi:hypothetical protein D9758_001884 [Tetrapyrgos nigripes]|uniref:Phospholipid/glycerol acyltransferase domain-containing protein n=1 Tax=Tetrapyrgos nigripes TaxID=182062 RepID=A0A8H5GTC3_9AGAR|nr:hypothetical protein D9758_001884 [Tetrapyrgos nigripes]
MAPLSLRTYQSSRKRVYLVCANHSNSLTDALLLVNAIPSSQRNMLRLTAKSTQFGKKTFTSWLIESAGTVPIHRRKDFEEPVDNSENMLQLIKALETGDAVCLFPEGMSRYHPTIAPLKTGVARLISDVLSRNSNEPDFEIALLSCSITYMHRQHWRSDVLITFHEPMIFTPKRHPELLKPVDYNAIRAVTDQLYQQISSGTIDSPSWDLVRISKLAARIYAPLGTRMTLGDHVRVVRAFLEALKISDSQHVEPSQFKFDRPRILQLRSELKAYQDELAQQGLKDDRIRKPLPRRVLLYRMMIRASWVAFLLLLSIPGLCLWFPVFATINYIVRNHKRSGPVFDTWDEITQNKLVGGLASGLFVWCSVALLTFPIGMITGLLVPVCMWFSMRWIEDGIAAGRAFVSLYRLLMLGKPKLKALQEQRIRLHGQVMDLALALGLPPDPETYFAEAGGREKGRVRGQWESRARYFSIKRRRKRDWNESLRLYDKVDYPEDDSNLG